MRDLSEVIRKMLAVTPPNEYEFIADLERCLSSADFSAPELMRMRWEQTAQTLWDSFGDDPTEDWQLNVMDVWNPGWRNTNDNEKP